jgi:hypothetical protein
VPARVGDAIVFDVQQVTLSTCAVRSSSSPRQPWWPPRRRRPLASIRRCSRCARAMSRAASGSISTTQESGRTPGDAGESGRSTRHQTVRAADRIRVDVPARLIADPGARRRPPDGRRRPRLPRLDRSRMAKGGYRGPAASSCADRDRSSHRLVAAGACDRSVAARPRLRRSARPGSRARSRTRSRASAGAPDRGGVELAHSHSGSSSNPTPSATRMVESTTGSAGSRGRPCSWPGPASGS